MLKPCHRNLSAKAMEQLQTDATNTLENLLKCDSKNIIKIGHAITVELSVECGKGVKRIVSPKSNNSVNYYRHSDLFINETVWEM